MSFSAHVRALIPPLISRKGLSHWQVSKAMGLGKEFWSRRLFAVTGQTPQAIRLTECAAILGYLGYPSGILLTGEATRQPFDALVIARLHGSFTSRDKTPSDADRAAGFTVGAFSAKTKASETPLVIESVPYPVRPLTLEDIDEYLAALQLPLGVMFSPALGPYDGRLLRRLDEKGRMSFRAAGRFLAHARGLYVASRPQPVPLEERGERDKGAVPFEPGKPGPMLDTTGCDRMVRRLLAQDLAELTAGPPPTITLTPAGAAVVATLA